MKPVWYTQLVNTVQTGEWDYPGAMAIMNDGFIYVVSGYRIFKVDPANGTVVTTLKPADLGPHAQQLSRHAAHLRQTPTEDAVNTSYNGINALPDGTIVVKSLYRVAGCTLNGPSALLDCPNAQNVPASILVSVDPKTMQIIDNITLPAPAGARPTITRYHGVDYVYLLENTSDSVRYSVQQRDLHPGHQLDALRRPHSGQTTGGSLIVMNDWIVGATNAVPAAGALTVFAINQGDATKVVLLQPYLHDPIPPELAKAFATGCQGGRGRRSAGPTCRWRPIPRTALFYGVETLARKIAAFKLTGSDITDRVEEDPDHHRMGHADRSEGSPRLGRHGHPRSRDPGQNATDRVVFRDAATGRELARSGRLPAMTQGSAVQPGYGGSVFFPGARGTLIKVTPSRK